MGRPPATHCKSCGTELNKYNTVWRTFSSKIALCHDCHRANERRIYQEGRFRKTPEQQRAANLKKNFGITIEEYDRMFELHQGGCAICRQSCKTGRRLSVDHNHRTGEIRGLLCVRCNAVLGQLDDNEDLIWDILEYLKRTTWKKEVA